MFVPFLSEYIHFIFSNNKPIFYISQFNYLFNQLFFDLFSFQIKNIYYFYVKFL